MQLAYRSTRRYEPNKSDTLVSSPEQAHKLIADLDTKLKTKLSGHERATYLCARAVLYEALGDQKMLEAAQEAFKFSKTAQSCALVAVALHHFGRIKEALQYYEQSYRFPHEPGYEVDIGYQGALLFRQTAESWLKAWEITLSLKKRMCYAAYLPTWDGRPTKELQVLSEGGYGDLIQNSRYLSKCTEIAEHVTVFLPPYFFQSGFVDLMCQQSWCPEIKPLTEAKPNTPSAGFFDLPAIFQTIPSEIPNPPVWKVSERRHLEVSANGDTRPKVGIVWAARAMETPICQASVYRELGREQAQKLVSSIDVHWVSLQVPDAPLDGVERMPLKSWLNTAVLIDSLDVIVSVDTAVPHLAASMGKKVHVLLSGAVDWKFGMDGNSCLWYPTMTLWRNGGWGFETALDNFIRAASEGSLF